MTTGAQSTALDLLALADRADAEGRRLEAITVLTDANRLRADPALEFRLARLRHDAWEELDRAPGFDTWPVPVRVAEGAPAIVPEITASDLSLDQLRRSIATHGSLLVRGLLDAERATGLTEGIDRSLVGRTTMRDQAEGDVNPWYQHLPLDWPAKQSLGRHWIAAGGGTLTADSPRMLFTLFELFEAAGVRDLVAGYLGERPVMSANKCTLRRVPLSTHAGWHQDGAFLGPGIRALNIWTSLSHCGRDAPGLDIVPRRMTGIVDTGGEGAYFDWAVRADVVANLARETPIVRPEFAPGDVLFFDDLLLHCSAVDATMTRERYAIESWFFAPSAYPEGHVPVVW
jgi:hypothetical protein